METSGASRPCPASVCLIRRPPVSEPIYLGQFDFSKITPAEGEKAFPNYRLEAIGNPGREALNVRLPSTITVHAPHSAMLQPNFVPLSPSVSRSTHSSGVRGSSLFSTGRPFTVIRIAMSCLQSVETSDCQPGVDS
jgi:hypothetical protein